MPRALALLLLVASATAQGEIYKWTDASGRVHFGDSAAGAGKPAEAVTPRSATGTPATTPATAPADGEAAQDRRRRLLETFQREAAEREAASRRDAEEKSRQAQECQRLRDALSGMEGRVAYTRGADGEPRYLDDQQRQAYVDKANAYLQQHCQ